MNEEYTTLSTTSNILQCIFDTLQAIDDKYIELPIDQNEIMSDIQAVVARKTGKVAVC